MFKKSSPALIFLTGILTALSTAGPVRAEPTPARSMTVRFVYLVSADRPVRSDFKEAITKAALEVQRFYASQLDGATFRLNDPVVEIAKSDKAAAWFYAHDTGGAKDNWGFVNALAEARRLLGAGHGQNYIWIIYSDGPGNSGRGGGGVAVMPEDDLLGLVGQHPTQKDARRWVYGMAHELGHALGLPHPPDLDAVPNAVMGRGFYTCFPDACELTPEDRKTLRASPFVGVWRADETWSYNGGRFVRNVDLSRARWTEFSDRDNATYTFNEIADDGDDYVLFDRTRSFFIRIPRAGGQSRHSVDAGETWRNLYLVTREAP